MLSRSALALMLLCASGAGAQSFLRTHVPGSNICLFWANRSLTYSPDSAGYSKVNVFPALDAAYASWQAQAATCSEFTFVKGAQITGATVGYDPNSSNANVLIFREVNCSSIVPPGDPCLANSTCMNAYRCWSHDDYTIALTTTTFSNDTGVIYDADTEFNASPHTDGTPAFLFTVVDSPPCDASNISESCVATDVQETMTHETGHAIGLDHVNISGSTMEPTAPLGETQKRTIDTGTGTGFCTIYPLGQPSPPCDPSAALSQKITATNQGTAGLSSIGCQSTAGWVPGLAVLALLARRRRFPRPG
jgi:hypothetical protein